MGPVKETGLLDVIIEAFRSETGIAVAPSVVEVGKAERVLESKEASVLVTDAPAIETRLRGSERAVETSEVWRGRFVVLGPAKESDRSYGEGNYVSEMGYDWPDITFKKPYVGNARTFVAEIQVDPTPSYFSRGGVTSTTEVERALGYRSSVRTERSAVETVLAANEAERAGAVVDANGNTMVGAYVVTDEASYLRVRDRIQLHLVLAEAPELIDRHRATLIRPAGRGRMPANARRLYEWLKGERCRALVHSTRVAGQRVFFAPDEPVEGLPYGRLDRPFTAEVLSPARPK
jgi:tungstate transport system substrate-binding protein